MNVIPVIDLRDGEVVRGVGGRRDEYRRVQTILTEDNSPAGIAHAFAAQFGFTEIYIADLDAIAGAEPNWAAYEAIGQSGLRLWVDAGAGDKQRATTIASFGGAAISHVVLGLESLSAAAEFPAIVNACGAERMVFSLDLKHGRPITSIASWHDASPERIAQEAMQSGVRRMIVLDLAHVGEGRGPGAVQLCFRLHALFPHLELIGGGGVRNLADAGELAAAGCRGVLIGSALHDGRLKRTDIEAIRRRDAH